jgi:hypothetical protein
MGSGGTGKGTFMRVATALVGTHNSVTTNLKEMEENKFETANFLWQTSGDDYRLG